MICADDPVIDFMVMEAVSLKVQAEDAKLQKEAQKDAARSEFKDTRNNKEAFDRLRELAG